MSNTAALAARLHLPRIIWTSSDGFLRVVAVYESDDDTIERVVERHDGFDTLGATRWRALPRATWNESLQCRIADDDWITVADALMADLPLDLPAEQPASAQARIDAVADVLAAEYRLARANVRYYREANEQITENNAAVCLVLEHIADKLGFTLPWNDPDDVELSRPQTQAARVSALLHERTAEDTYVVEDALLDAMVDIIRARPAVLNLIDLLYDLYDALRTPTPYRAAADAALGALESAKERLETAAQALGLAPLTDRATEALERAEHENADSQRPLDSF